MNSKEVIVLRLPVKFKQRECQHQIVSYLLMGPVVPASISLSCAILGQMIDSKMSPAFFWYVLATLVVFQKWEWLGESCFSLKSTFVVTNAIVSKWQVQQ